MKVKINGNGNGFLSTHAIALTRAFIVAGFLFGVLPWSARAYVPVPGGTNDGPTYTVLDSWSFYDHTNWTSDYGYAPVSFTNLSYSFLGDGESLVMNTNISAWLQYNVVEDDNTTNLTVNQGTVSFWFAPGWSSTNSGGTGPGEYGRLFETGGYTSNSSYGWWSIYVDEGGNNIYFSAQTNDLSSNVTTYLSAPISWTTNYFHNVLLTYTSTNTILYMDGSAVTNGPGVTVYPGQNALTNGFYIGSDSTGILQAEGLFNDLYTFNVPLDPDTIQGYFKDEYIMYEMSPWNTAMFNMSSAPSSPSTGSTLDAITGIGNLLWDGSTTSITNTNAYNIWITNVTAAAASGGTMNITFTIQGGQPGYYYDVFANSVLSFGVNGVPWAWEGQGTNSGIYTVNISGTNAVANAFLILGTPQDSYGAELTDAYQLLVSKTFSTNASDPDGLLTGWDVLLGLNPHNSNLTNPSERSNYGYTSADWLNGVSGIKSGAVTNDAEGNVLSVSQ